MLNTHNKFELKAIEKVLETRNRGQLEKVFNDTCIRCSMRNCPTDRCETCLANWMYNLVRVHVYGEDWDDELKI